MEYAPRHANDAFILAHANAKLDDSALKVPPGAGRKAEEHETPAHGGNRECSCKVLKLSGQRQGRGRGLDHTRRLRGIAQLLAVSYCRRSWARGGKAGRLNRKTYMTVTATLFFVVAIIHLLRIIFGWQVEIGGLSIPFWVSWLGVLAAGALAYFGFTQKR